MRYALTILIGLLLTVTTVTAHPTGRLTIPGVTTMHEQKFLRPHLLAHNGQFNRFLVNHSSVISGVVSTIPGGDGNPYALAINHAGVVSASSVIRQDGKILLKSDAKETAFDLIHTQAWDNAYDQAFLADYAAKHQENHDNQWGAQFDLSQHDKQQQAHQNNHDTVKRNLRIYKLQIEYVYNPPYIEVYYPPYTEYYMPPYGEYYY